jgi:hypothetical protein
LTPRASAAARRHGRRRRSPKKGDDQLKAFTVTVLPGQKVRWR